jgi:TonB family protein
MVPLSFGIALKGTAVLAVVWLAAQVLRRRSAAVRHLLWTVCAAVLIALPILSIALPAWPVPAGRFETMMPAITFRVDGSAAAPAATPARAPVGTSATAAPARMPWPLPDSGKALLWLWTVGAMAVLGHTLLAYARMSIMRRRARPHPEAELCGSLGRCFGIRHAVEIREFAAGSMPMTFGLWRPTLFLPADAETWTPERRRMVVLHELAHVVRGDAAAHVVARAALALFWWNPLAWIAWRHLLKEGERAADDLVLRAGEPAAEYAGLLLDVARGMHEGSPYAAVAMARRSQLEGRLVAILDPRVNRQAPRRAWAWVALVASLAAVAPVAALRAQEGVRTPLPNAAFQTRASEPERTNSAPAQAARPSPPTDSVAQVAYSAAQVARPNSTDISTDAPAQAAKPSPVNPGNDNAEALIAAGASMIKESPVEAQNLLERGLNAAASGPQAGRAATWLGYLAATKGLAEVAESRYQEALSLEEPRSPGAAFTMELYSALLSDQSRMSAAEAMSAQAAAIRKVHVAELSPKAPDTLALERVDTGTAAPMLLRKVEPQYSEEARVTARSGTVILRITVGEDGLVYDISLMKSLGMGLDEKAEEAVAQWHFRPGFKDRQPVPVSAQVEVNFRLISRPD